MCKKRRNYTPEQKAFLKSYIPEHYHAEVVEEFNRRWPDAGFTKQRSINFCKDNAIHSVYHKVLQDGGKIPVEIRGGATKTTFKKGNRPANSVPVGTIRKNTDGYMRKKIAEPNKWIFVSHLVWEEHNGPIPKGYAVFHVNGVFSDDRIENLMLMTKSEVSRANSLVRKLKLTSSDDEIRKSIALYAKITDKVARLQTKK